MVRREKKKCGHYDPEFLPEQGKLWAVAVTTKPFFPLVRPGKNDSLSIVTALSDIYLYFYFITMVFLSLQGNVGAIGPVGIIGPSGSPVCTSLYLIPSDMQSMLTLSLIWQ